MSNSAAPIVSLEESAEVWLDLDSGVRLRKLIYDTWQARDWAAFEAAPQSGKSFTAMRVRAENKPVKRGDGITRIPVAIGESAGRLRARHLARTIARSVGLPQIADLDNIAFVMARAGTTLLIVTDGHNLEMVEWRDLLTLHNTCKEQHGLEFALVVLGVRTPNIYGTSGTDPIALQVRARLQNRGRIPGLVGPKVGEALALICDAYAPSLVQESFDDHWRDVLSALEARSLASGGEVVARPLIRLVRYAGAIRKLDPALSTDELIRRAVDELSRERLKIEATQAINLGVKATKPASARISAA